LLPLTVLLALVLGAVAGEPVAPVAAPKATTPTTPAVVTAAVAKPVALVLIDDQTDEHRATYFKRALATARAQGVGTVVVHITSPGGPIGPSEDMAEAALAAARSGMRMVCFVERGAWSGGALLAYAHQEVYLTTSGKIGDIGVIYFTQEGKVEYAPEKFESPMRALLRQLAEANGWNPAKLQKMTARNQELYRFDLPSGQAFVLEGDLAVWLKDHPEAKPEGKVLVKGKDVLLSYTGREAVAEGMATALVQDLDAVLAKVGTTRASLIDLAPTSSERLSWKLAPWASALIGLAVLFLFLEFKMPSGVFLALAIASGALFFVCQYYLELAGNLELVMVVVGTALIIAEIFWLPTSGIVGFAGLAVAVTGLVMAFMPDDVQFSPSLDGWGTALGSAIAQSGLALVIIAVGLVVFIRALPRSRLLARIAANAEITATSAGDAELHASELIGRRALCRTELRPTGFIDCAGRELSAITEHGEMLAAGSSVEIVGMRFGEAVVRPAPGATT